MLPENLNEMRSGRRRRPGGAFQPPDFTSIRSSRPGERKSICVNNITAELCMLAGQQCVGRETKRGRNVDQQTTLLTCIFGRNSSASVFCGCGHYWNASRDTAEFVVFSLNKRKTHRIMMIITVIYIYGEAGTAIERRQRGDGSLGPKRRGPCEERIGVHNFRMGNFCNLFLAQRPLRRWDKD